MTKKITKILAILLTVICLCSALSACGASSINDGGFVKGENTIGMPEAEMDGIFEDSVSNSTSSGSNSTSQQSPSITNNRKIIEKIYFSLQTKNFDNVTGSFESKVLENGGYIEKSQIDGKDFDYDYTQRTANYVVRIPSEKVDVFCEYISGACTVMNKEVTTDDVTLKYVDMESRVKALTTEQESLERLLEKAESVSDIITIREQLTNVIYQIESYKSQLRTYDNLIEFTTITIDIREVEKEEIVEELTVWEEIVENLKNNFEDIGDGFTRLFVSFISNLPYLVILAIIALICVFIIKKIIKKAKSKITNTSHTYTPSSYSPNNTNAEVKNDIDEQKNKDENISKE